MALPVEYHYARTRPKASRECDDGRGEPDRERRLLGGGPAGGQEAAPGNQESQ